MNFPDLPDRPHAARLLADLLQRPACPPPAPLNQPLVLYGAGNLGRLAADLLDRLGIPVAYAIDRQPPPDGLLLGHIPVLRPEQAPMADRASHRVAVCVVLAPYQPIAEALGEMGWQHVQPFYDIAEAYADRLPMGNGWFAGNPTPDEAAGIADVLESWHDDASRAAHLQYLAWRMHRAEWTFAPAPIRTDDRYFPELIQPYLDEKTVFLDAGAYHGEVIARFAALMGDRFAGAIGIEPDPAHVAQLQTRLDALSLAHPGRALRLLHCALGRTAAPSAPFCSELGMGARLFAQGAARVARCRLDDLDLTFGFAKFHLEGSELEAIEGGLETLRRQRPLLAVTTYHNRDGLYALPQRLMQQLPDYRFYLRLHAWCATGAVLYGIPGERSPTRGRQS